MVRSTLRTSFTTAVLAGALATPAFAGISQVPGQYPNIQEAIDNSVAGDMILIADGTYTGPGNCDVSCRISESPSSSSRRARFRTRATRSASRPSSSPRSTWSGSDSSSICSIGTS